MREFLERESMAALKIADHETAEETLNDAFGRGAVPQAQLRLTGQDLAPDLAYGFSTQRRLPHQPRELRH
jgi:hypothetical protein